MDSMGIRTILLLTDNQRIISEAIDCARENPLLCEGIIFKYVNTTRLSDSQGKSVNDAPIEFRSTQMEQSLSQRCSIALVGHSEVAKSILTHMGCGFPFPPRGVTPHTCLLPPHIQIAIVQNNEQCVGVNCSSIQVCQVANEYNKCTTHLIAQSAELLTALSMNEFILAAKKQLCLVYDFSAPLKYFC